MKKDTRASVLIVEDDLDFQYLIRQAIEAEADMAVAGCTASPKEAVSMAVPLAPSIVLMDLSLSGSFQDGTEASRQIRLHTDAKVLILTSFEDPHIVIRAAVRGLAHGYIFKSHFSLLVENIRKAVQGATPEEMMIRSLILSCLSPAEYSIFEIMLGREVTLQSSPKTIANQKTMVLKKLDLPSQSALVHIFREP